MPYRFMAPSDPRQFGCPDGDDDGWSDDNDWAPNDPEQWVDTDGDGYGDNYYYEIVSTFSM